MNDLISIKNYEYDSWASRYQNNKVDLKSLYIHPDWHKFFDIIKADKEKRFDAIEKFLSHCLSVSEGKIKIYPYPDLVFSSFNWTPFKKVKVVILGQDPYHQNETIDDQIIPQAMGLSFSVPVGMKIPSSLNNIYKNLIKYKHLNEMPKHGNLEFWCYQGVLMLNTSLTVQHGFPNGHSKHWSYLTDQLIEYISKNSKNTVFVLWGAPAYSKKSLIDETKHLVIASSHPSGLSCHNKMGKESAFVDQDHFTLINDYLEKHNKGSIIWNI